MREMTKERQQENGLVEPIRFDEACLARRGSGVQIPSSPPTETVATQAIARLTGESSVGASERLTKPTDEWAALAGLRFALASIVLLGHAALLSRSDATWTVWKLDPGAAVIGFLLVSGYSMAHSLSREGAAAPFYARRARRLLPTYCAGIALGAIACVASRGLLEMPNGSALGPTSIGEVLGNLVFVQGLLVAPYAFNGPLWSLAVEVWYYAAAPALNRASTRLLWIFIGASAAAYLWHRELGWQDPSFAEHGQSGVMLLWAWLLGFAYYRQRGSAAAPALRIAMISLSAWLVAATHPGYLYGAWTVAVSAALIAEAPHLTLPVSWRKPLLYLGDLSYPLYVVHYPVMGLCCLVVGAAPALWCCVSLAAAVATLHLVDRPGRKMRLC